MAAASSRRRGGAADYIWPGYVDALTTLLMVLIFLLTLFSVAQFTLSSAVSTRDSAIEPQYFYPGLDELERLGHDGFRFTIEADMGHDVWARVYAGRDLYDWLLGCSREPAPKR